MAGVKWNFHWLHETWCTTHKSRPSQFGDQIFSSVVSVLLGKLAISKAIAPKGLTSWAGVQLSVIWAAKTLSFFVFNARTKKGGANLALVIQASSMLFLDFSGYEFQPTWWEMLCMISRGWPPQGLRKVASVSEPPKLAHCTHVAAGGHGHFQVSWINRGSWFFQSPRCLSNPMKHLCSQFSLLLMLVLFLNSYEAVVQGMSQEDVLC